MKIINCLLICLLLITITACSDGSSNSTTSSLINNSVPLVVDRGYNESATNVAFINVTICQSGTINCQTVDHVFVDTGSTGFRINQSQLTLTGLSSIEFNGNPLYQCMQYGSGYDFGQVVDADIKLGDEIAYKIPIQIINDMDQNNIPLSCTQGLPFNNFSISGARAIIGINVTSNPNNLYTNVYSCSNNHCAKIESPNLIPTKLNINPISAFTQDNNGAIIDLPEVSTTFTNTAIVGSLIFGLNTQENNIVPESANKLLGSSNIDDGFFLANAESQNSLGIFDSGTPTLSFYSSEFQQCESTGLLSGLYCPINFSQTWISKVASYSGENITLISSPIINYSSFQFTNFPVIMPYIGQFSELDSYTTIYGLPFFLGRQVYLGFKGSESSGAITPLGTGPAWGFTN